MEKRESIEYTEKLAQATPAGNGVELLNENGEVRRIPVPSADPNDPLNLNKWRKLGIIVTCCWYSIFSLVLVGGAGPILPAFFAEYGPEGKSTDEVVNLTTYPSLVMALGAFLILPLSMVFGRRPVMLGCCLLLVIFTVTAATSRSYNMHMASRILQGVATGATESVLPLIITDISFLDERGLLFGCYWGSQNLVNAIFTITASYIAADLGWRWFYWILTILSGAGVVLVFFCLPETRYQRSPMSLNGQVYHTDEFGVTRTISNEEAAERYAGTLDLPTASQFPPEITYMQTLKPTSVVAPDALKLTIGAAAKMVASLSSPGVLWAIMATSISLGTGIAMTLTYGTLLTTSFGWSEASVGLINAGIFPAALLSMLWAGWLTDKMNIWLAKRAGGVHLPEHSLVMLVPPTLVSIIGIVVYATTANQPATHSSWGLIMGWTLYEFGFIVILITSTHFAAEAYPDNPGPALVMVVGMKNVVSFGASYGITPMVHKFNYLTAYMILLGIFCAIFLLGIPVYFLNPKWRAMIASRQQSQKEKERPHQPR